MEKIIPEGVKKILKTLKEAGFEAVIVGGCVRDALLKHEPKDFDITTSALPREIKSLFRRTVDTGIEHGTVTVLMGDGQYEVTTYRVDGAYTDHRHPEEVTFTRSLEEDLKRRDFTINAMCYSEDTGLIDMFGGVSDLENGVIRAVGDPEKRFDEDALRIMRALRFAAQLQFDIEEKTYAAVRRLAPTLEAISAERIRDELFKLITSPDPGYFADVVKSGVCAVILPEFLPCMQTVQNNPYHDRNVGEHIIESMRHVRPDTVLRLTMLLHDIEKPAVRTTDENGTDHFYGHPERSAETARVILRRLKCDNKTIARVTNLIRYHDLLLKEGISERAIRRAANRVGEDFPLMFEIIAADDAAKSAYKSAEKAELLEKAKRVYEDALERGEAMSVKELAVNGKDLIEAGIPEGQMIGKTLKRMLEDVLDHPEHNTREHLLENFV